MTRLYSVVTFYNELETIAKGIIEIVTVVERYLVTTRVKK